MSQGILKANQDYLIESGRSDLNEKLTPTSLSRCRRVVQSSTFFQTVTKDHVSIIKDPIKKINENVVTTEDGSEHQVDVLVLGTGYETRRGSRRS